MRILPPISTHLRRLARLPLISPRQWLRRIVFWAGAVIVAVVAISFATLANLASNLFVQFQAPRPWVAFIVCPAGLVASFLLTRYIFPGAQGSGIPQVIAVQHMTDRAAIARVLSLRIAAGKIALTLLGLASGASIGREGPTVQVGAAIMHALGRSVRLPRLELSARWCWLAARPASPQRSTRRLPALCSPSRNSATRSRHAPPAPCSPQSSSPASPRSR